MLIDSIIGLFIACGLCVLLPAMFNRIENE